MLIPISSLNVEGSIFVLSSLGELRFTRTPKIFFKWGGIKW